MLKRLTLPFLVVALCGPFAAGDDHGTIVFYRPKSDAGKPSLFCDGVRLARLPGESVFSVQAAAGRHVCTVDRVGNTKEAVDAPLATTYYYPAKTATVRDGLSFWRVYPYIERHGDGSACFDLRLSLYPPKARRTVQRLSW